MRRLLPVLILMLVAAAARAGPWPRETGAVFLATGGTYRFDVATGLRRGEGNIYVEYGLPRRITLGFDGFHTDTGAAQALIFARVPLGREDRRLKLALGVGLGGTRAGAGAGWAGIARAGLAVGRDHRLGRGGWWTIGTAIEADRANPLPLARIDATFGLGLTPRLQGLVQVEGSARDSADAQVALIPGVIWRLGPRARLHLGIEARAFRMSRQAGLRASVWRDF